MRRDAERKLAELDAYYDSSYHAARHGHLLEDDEYFLARAEASARLYFGRFARPLGRVLDYGCGIGQGYAAIEGAVGFDVSREAVSACERRGLRVMASKAEIPGGAFDYVICRHVLEHVPDPLCTLRDLFSYLRPDGTLILVLPKERHTHAPFEPDLNQHLFCWNFRTINNLIALAGGMPQKNEYVSVVGYRALLPLRRILGREVYYHATRLAGWIFSVTELVVHAKPIGR